MADGYDGSIRIATPVDDSGVNQGTNRIGQAMRKLKSKILEVGRANQEAFGPKQQKQIDTLTQRFERQKDAAAKAARAAEDIRRQYDAIVSGEKTPASLKGMETELKKVQREIGATEKSYAELEARMETLQQKAYFEKQLDGVVSPATAAEIANLEKELDKTGVRLHDLDQKSAKLEETIGRIKLDPSQSIEAQKLSNQLKTASDNASRLQEEASTTARQLGEASQQSNNLEQAPKRATKAMGLFAAATRNAGKEIEKTQKQTNGLTGSVNKLGKRLLSLTSAALVFNVIRKALRSLSSYLGSVIKTNNQFVSSLSQIKGNLLTAFQPIWEAITPALNALAAALAKVTAYIASFVNLLFGKSISASQGAAKSLYNQAKGYGAAGKAAEKASRQLAAFDDINVLTQENADSGGGSAGADINPGFDAGLFDDIGDTAKNVFEKIKKAVQPLIAPLQNLWEQLKRVGEFTWQSLVDFYDYFLVPVGSWVLGEGLPSLITALADGLAGVNFDRISSALVELWRALTPFAINVGKGLVWFFENALIPLGQWTLNEVVPRFLNLLSKAIDFLNTVIDTIKPGIMWIWDEFLHPIAEWTGGIILDVLDYIGEKFEQVTKWIKENGEDINNVLIGIGKVFKLLWEEWVAPILENVWNTIEGVIDSILEILGGLIIFLSGVFTGDIEKVLEGIKGIFKGIFNGIISIVEGAANAMVTALNLVIKGLNLLLGNIPDWVPLVGGFQIPEIPDVDLPRLATGAVIPPNSEFLAILGDQKHGANIEAPASLIESIVDSRISPLVDAIEALVGGYGGGTGDTVIQIDGREVFRASKNYERRVGTNLRKGAAY